MTERKRRKVADALSRLTASVEDIRTLGEELSQLVKSESDTRVLPLRVVASAATNGAARSNKNSKLSTSLLSLVSASTLRDAADADNQETEKNWRSKLTQVAKELTATDHDALDRCSRLLRRFDSLAGTIKLYEAKLQQHTSDVALSDQIESRLEQEERAWEQAMAQRETRVAELEEELQEIQRANEELSEEQVATHAADADVVIESEVAQLENQSLRETLALRMEEKRDIEAAIESLRRKKRRRAEEHDANTVSEGDRSEGRNAQLREELKELLGEKEELQTSILSMETAQDESEAEQQDVAALKTALQQSKTQRQHAQDQLDKLKHVLAKLKTKMKHMVDVQLLSARDTNPPTLSEEMAILHLLYAHEGEMDMHALKTATTELLAQYGKNTSSAAVLRAIYSLVGSLAVHIDRSIGNGVVTSLLVLKEDPQELQDDHLASYLTSLFSSVATFGRVFSKGDRQYSLKPLSSTVSLAIETRTMDHELRKHVPGVDVDPTAPITITSSTFSSSGGMIHSVSASEIGMSTSSSPVRPIMQYTRQADEQPGHTVSTPLPLPSPASTFVPRSRARSLKPLKSPHLWTPVHHPRSSLSAVSDPVPGSISASSAAAALAALDASDALHKSPEANKIRMEVQRFERMIDRFQLRRVPSTTQSHTSGGGVVGLRSPRRGLSRTSSINGLAPEDVEHHAGGPRPSLTEPASPLNHHALAAVLAATTASHDAAFSTTFLRTSVSTRLRLCAVIVAFSVKLVYMPYAIAYYQDRSGMLFVNSMVDVVFVLNMLATCNTETHINRTHAITTRRAIWRHYRRHGFATDLFAAIPFEFVLLAPQSLAIVHWVVCLVRMGIQFVCVYRHVDIYHEAWTEEVIGADKSVVAWMIYSRYSPLVRIGGIVVLILLLAHYFACMWSWLHTDVDPEFFADAKPLTVHMHSIYDAIQLLQGQGVETKTPAQAIFGSVAVLLGSIALAVVFGHVAILVANFSANNTAYQHKMERVFSIMAKQQLPLPIRERVHQYYEYLHAEYESLDGEVVKFAKDLSHTLELEVVLFKYMDVLMHVPHWRNCSPDFQKQLVLNLSVRVYLPDDFIMRRGEVGTQCYIINRGMCLLYEYPTGNFEPPTEAMEFDDDLSPYLRARSSTRSLLVARKQTATRISAIHPTGQIPKFSMFDGGQSNSDDTGDGPHCSVTELTRGQAIGDMALLSNYERSSDMRAVTYVEMCVIERETFQRILTRYPRDREVVLGSIVGHNMTRLHNQHVPFALLNMAMRVCPQATIPQAIEMVSRAMNPPENDPTIVFGVTQQLSSRLQRNNARNKYELSDNDDDNDNKDNDGNDMGPASGSMSSSSSRIATSRRQRSCATRVCESTGATTTPPPAVANKRLIQEIRERLNQLERQSECAACHARSVETESAAPPLGRRHSSLAGGTVSHTP